MSLVLAACGGDGESADEASPTAVVTTSVTTTTLATTTTQATTTTTEPTTTTTTQPTTTTSTVSDEQLAAAAAVGDIAAGEELFDTRGVRGTHDNACSSCHLPGAEDGPFAPSLVGVSAVAADRVEGMSEVDYLRQSIVDPRAFRVEGEWGSIMPYQYSEAFSEDQINNLIAFLLTR